MTSPTDPQTDLFSPVTDLELAQMLLADLNEDLIGKVSRFRRLCDLSETLGSQGTMIQGGETAFSAWTEARSNR